MSWTLYRLYDADGDLIYIGVTSKPDLTARLRSHRYDYSQMMEYFADAVMETRRYEVRSEAWAAERHAILTELPQFNAQHVPGRQNRGVPIRARREADLLRSKPE